MNEAANYGLENSILVNIVLTGWLQASQAPDCTSWLQLLVAVCKATQPILLKIINSRMPIPALLQGSVLVFSIGHFQAENRSLCAWE